MAKLAFGTRAAEGRPPRYTTETRTLQVSEDIIPIADLKARMSEVVRSLDERGRPVIVTLNGKAAAVLMSPKEYDRFAYRERVVAKINEGLRDAAEGRTHSHEEVGRMLDARFRITSKTKSKKR